MATGLVAGLLAGTLAVAGVLRDPDDDRDPGASGGTGPDARGVTFPLVASDDGRSLLTSDGEPFPYLADTVGLAPSRLDVDELRRLLDTRADQGFTALQVSLLPFVHLPGGLENALGDPAVRGTDLSAPVEVGERTSDPASPDYDYWDHVDVLLTLAAERDLQVTVVPSWYGYQGEDWRGSVDAGSAAAYGRFVGERLGHHPNLMWLLGGDNDPLGDVAKVPDGGATGDVKDATRAMAEAIVETEAVPHLMSYHAERRVSSLQFFADDDWHTFTSAYSAELTWQAVADSSGRGDPVVMTEAYYDGREEAVLDRRALRAQAWWSVLGGAGFAYGHEDVWDLDPGHGPDSDAGVTWTEALDDPSALDVGVLAEAVRDLVPLRPADDDVLVAGRGDGAGRAVAALAADGRTALVYLPEARPVEVALDAVGGDRVAVSWLDPADGEVQEDGVHPATGTTEVTPPDGLEDSVLILRGE